MTKPVRPTEEPGAPLISTADGTFGETSSLPYVLPFVAFLALLAVFGKGVLISPLADEILRDSLMAVLIVLASRKVLRLQILHWAGDIALGAAIFLVWLAPDLFSHSYRHFWLFENSITGAARSSFPEQARHNSLVLVLRSLRAVAIVPVVEELFWRGWLLRWLIKPNFWTVAMGAYTAASFWVVALLFASEHGAYWDVGLAAGILFNLWMVRTRSLGDLIITHAVANACLSGYVIFAGRWEYW